MPDPSHYDVLGLDLSASPSAIRASLRRLVRHADELAYHDAAASAALWERIRQIQRDLLSGHARRSAYDLALLHAAGMATSATAEPVELPRPPLRVDAARPVTQHQRVPILPAALVAGIILLVAAFSVLSLARHGVQTARPPVAGLYTGGPVHSGQTVHLHWSHVPHATLYRVQILTGQSASASQWRSARVVTTHHTGIDLAVVGRQTYRYRVQALVNGHWTRFGHARSFTVLPPVVSRPVALQVRRTTHHSALLCWHTVPHAIGYRLHVGGAGTRVVHGTCAWVVLKPGRHGWSVAALVPGTQTYMGPTAGGGQFVVRASPPRLIAAGGPGRQSRHATASTHAGHSTGAGKTVAARTTGTTSGAASRGVAAVVKTTGGHHRTTSRRTTVPTRVPTSPPATRTPSRPRPTAPPRRKATATPPKPPAVPTVGRQPVVVPRPPTTTTYTGAPKTKKTAATGHPPVYSTTTTQTGVVTVPSVPPGTSPTQAPPVTEPSPSPTGTGRSPDDQGQGKDKGKHRGERDHHNK
ncbi:MAG TPA: hypothetical protein VFB58_02440 [Chloroflexota bacterium]|nr:hypothetical protein [Chloroflexota bacterium]